LLEAAVACGQPDAFENLVLLLKHGVAVDAQDKSQSTALHYAVRVQSLEAVALLLAHHPNLNLRDTQKMTPLDYATMTPGYPPHIRDKVVHLFKQAEAQR